MPSKQMAIKLSDVQVIRDVKHKAKIADRSMAGQIEHWVKLGQAVEALLSTTEVNTLKEYLKNFVHQPDAESVKMKILSSINQFIYSSDRRSVKDRILSHGGPVFQSDTEHPGRVIRIMPDGTRASGTIHEGAFVPVATRRGR
ncbi:MAG: hypothetical protein HY896_10870 [Deltaproteobacteria bacterium]|nr:hypothetical protein [Deltaproteobacteria bacterium]